MKLQYQIIEEDGNNQVSEKTRNVNCNCFYQMNNRYQKAGSF